MTDTPVCPPVPDKRPGVVWYAVAVGLLLGAVGLFAGSLVVQNQRISRALAAMPRVTLPVGGAVTLEAAGTYSLFYEGPPAQALAGARPAAGVAPGAPGQLPGARIGFADVDPSVTIERVVEGVATPIAARRSVLVPAYPRDDFNGYAVMDFDAPAPGSYVVRGTISQSEPQTPAVIAVGRLDVIGILGRPVGVFGAAAILAFAFVTSSVMAIVVYILRNKGLAETR